VQEKLSSTGLLHHEDLEVGKTYTSGTKAVTKDEILSFGRAYDPQPIHVDEEAAKKTLVGGLCASGWHTCAMMMRLVADSVLNNVASLGSPGVEEIRWLAPVRPSDRLRVRVTILDLREPNSRPDFGFVRTKFEVINARDEVVMHSTTNMMMGRRTPRPAQA